MVGLAIASVICLAFLLIMVANYIYELGERGKCHKAGILSACTLISVLPLITVLTIIISNEVCHKPVIESQQPYEFSVAGDTLLVYQLPKTINDND